MYFYTLHNQEHAIVLIQNIVKLIHAIDFLKISAIDYYILFLACYLHDISMVKIPALDSFLTDTNEADELAQELLDEFNKELQKDNLEEKVTENAIKENQNLYEDELDILSVKKYMLESYKKLDEYFEKKIRGRHAIDSSSEIRQRAEIKYLDMPMRELVAEVSEAHGADERNIYSIKSNASSRLMSIKFDKILLRLADLLDMSSYRVSKPILYHNMEQMSEESAFHWISHLLTQGYKLRTKYEIGSSKSSGTDNLKETEERLENIEGVLTPQTITEKLILEIPVDISQMSTIECENPCRKVQIGNISRQEITLICGEGCQNKSKGNYANRWKMLEDKKLSAVKEIFDEYGSEEVERFGSAVKNVHDVANKLGRFLKPNEMSSIIEKCFIGILSKEFTINCLISFVYTQGAEKLLETSLCHMKDEFTLEILSKIPFSLQLLDVINQVIDDDIAYWEKGAMPYGCCEDEAEELKIIVEKLIACKRYVTAVNIIGHSECEAVINAECIYKLMKLAGTEESIGGETLDDYAVQKIIGWFQQQEDIDLELRSDIEFIYLPMLDEYSEVRPRALNTRLSLEPEYFCSLIELFYKKRNGEKREIELNKSLSDRLCEILFQFKVTPGIDWNGNFDAKRFDYWMKTVKTWSRDNDRYEAAMHTVGLGLSYAELDEDKLPQTAVIEELNRVENDELRRGYYLGTINQRGAHWVDPEGKPELELAEDYENRANIAESRGYSRYAGILRVIADEFKREAKSNILEAKNGDDE